MQKELLIPVGNKEMLYQAIHGGADAVYLGGYKFSARHYSENFSEEELKEAVSYCHLYGVKIYVTVNTMIYEKEVEDFLEYIKYLYEIGVDALIMQDLGMISCVRKLYPDFEIHASTQMHTCNQETVNYLEELGVSRVVLARELSLDEIKEIKTPLEKEVFIHGALCISYSGCCLFSSLVGGRSGNRGECAGSCRLPYTLLEEEKEIETDGRYLLSTKELMSIENFKEILNSDIKSLKIEGRMKSPMYVRIVTHIYKSLMNQYERGEELHIDLEEIEKLKTIFNREFTKGFLSHATNQELMNIKSPNHIGIEIGKVIESSKKKIKIKLKKPLNQNDGIRFKEINKGKIVNYLYDKKDNLISSAKDFVYLDNDFSIPVGTTVLKTLDVSLQKEIENAPKKTIPISFFATIKKNETIKIRIEDQNNSIEEEGCKIEPAKKKATKEEEIIEKLSKIKDTPFSIKKINIEMDKDVFVPMTVINTIRRSLVEKLIEKRSYSIRNKKNNKMTFETRNKKQTNEISLIVRTERQLLAALKYKIIIYVDDYLLYKKYKEERNVFYLLDRVNKKYKEYEKNHILVSDLGAISFYKNKSVSSCYLNVANSYTCNYLLKDIPQVTLSVENSFEQIRDIVEGYKKRWKEDLNANVVLYGKVDLMITKYCPLNLLVNKDKICKVCRNKKQYYLKDRKEKCYPLIQKNEITHILMYKNIDYIEQVEKFKSIGITNFTIVLFDEEEQEIENILKKII